MLMEFSSHSQAHKDDKPIWIEAYLTEGDAADSYAERLTMRKVVHCSVVAARWSGSNREMRVLDVRKWDR